MMKTAKLIAGNWKMNGLGASLAEVAALRAALEGCLV
jgi:triosephosphate isomerase